MSPVHKLSAMGSITSNKIDYPSMLAGYGDFGALQRIAYQTGTGSAGEVALTGIPQTFQDLILVLNVATATATTGYPYFYVNTYATPNPSLTRIYGNGVSAVSDRNTQGTSGSVMSYSFAELNQTPTSAVIHILNYRSTTVNKTILARGAGDKNGAGAVNLTVIQSNSTLPITSINIATFAANCNFSTGSTFALYGVRASAA